MFFFQRRTPCCKGHWEARPSTKFNRDVNQDAKWQVVMLLIIIFRALWSKHLECLAGGGSPEVQCHFDFFRLMPGSTSAYCVNPIFTSRHHRA